MVSAMEAPMKRTLLALLAAVLLAPTAFATTATVNYSDLWWNPDESGWGVTVAQEGTTLFLTFYIYAPDGRPTWAVATLYRTAQSATGQPVFTGALHVTTGPYYGAPSFNPGAVTPRQAGTATFAPSDATTASLTYSIDGVNVTKSIRRQTLANENLGGSYVLMIDATMSCGGQPVLGGVAAGTVSVVHNGTTFQWRQYDPDVPSDYCVAVGTSVQEGQLTRASGPVTCSFASATGALNLTEITSTPIGLTGRYVLTLQQQGESCRLDGPFTALRQ
jgi:hypothetical protein